MMMTPDTTLGLYIHIPFCHAKCRYCDFYSAPAGEGVQSSYVNALIEELIYRAPKARRMRVDTVYIGGGTPTVLSPARFARLLDTVREHYALDPTAEITVECNPCAAPEGMFEGLYAAGVNRLSIGLQSANEKELSALGRLHDLAAFDRTFRAARAADFQNINVDLMMGIPHQTRESLNKTVGHVLSYAPEHISAYGLRVEEGTPFYRDRHTLPFADDDTVADMQFATAKTLALAGYEHYEISNYAKAGYRSRHNMRYWHCLPYLGFGAAAHSYFAGVRYESPRDTAGYIAAVAKRDFDALCQNAYTVSATGAKEEYVMLRMRLFEGISEADFAARFGAPFESFYGDTEKLQKNGLLTRGNGRIAFTEAGMYVSNAILSEWL